MKMSGWENLSKFMAVRQRHSPQQIAWAACSSLRTYTAAGRSARVLVQRVESRLGGAGGGSIHLRGLG